MFVLNVLDSLSFKLLGRFAVNKLVFFSTLSCLATGVVLPLKKVLAYVFIKAHISGGVLGTRLAGRKAVGFHLFSVCIFFVGCISPVTVNVMFLGRLNLLSRLGGLFWGGPMDSLRVNERLVPLWGDVRLVVAIL